MNHEQIAQAIKEARKHYMRIGDGRSAALADALLQDWTGSGPIESRHVDAVDSLWREQSETQVEVNF